MISINVRTSTTRRTVTADITSTPKSVFSELGIDTTGTHTNLDGAILSAADMNQTFERLGIADGSAVSMNSIVKADGAAAFAIVGDAFVITSGITLDEYNLLTKWRPDALKVKNEDGDDVFAISYADGRPCVAPFGVTFGGTTHNEDKFLTVTGMLPTDVKDPRDYLADLLAPIVENLTTLENSVPGVAAEVKASHDALVASINC